MILAGKQLFLEGEKLSAMDVYAYVILGRALYLDFNLSSLSKVAAFQERLKSYTGLIEAHVNMAAAAPA